MHSSYSMYVPITRCIHVHMRTMDTEATERLLSIEGRNNPQCTDGC